MILFCLRSSIKNSFINFLFCCLFRLICEYFYLIYAFFGDFSFVTFVRRIERSKVLCLKRSVNRSARVGQHWCSILRRYSIFFFTHFETICFDVCFRHNTKHASQCFVRLLSPYWWYQLPWVDPIDNRLWFNSMCIILWNHQNASTIW